MIALVFQQRLHAMRIEKLQLLKYMLIMRIVLLMTIPIAIFKNMYVYAGLALFIWLLSRGHSAKAKDTGISPSDIIYLRAFADQDANSSFFNRLLPILGCFGRPLAVANTQSFRFNLLYAFMNWIRGTPGRLGFLRLDDDWKTDIAEVIRTAKFAIIDLSTPTDNVKWELEAVVEKMGFGRVVILVCDEKKVADARLRYLKIPVLAHASCTLEYELAIVLKNTLGPPNWQGRVALSIALKQGGSFCYYSWNILCEFASTFRRGLRP